MTDKEYKYQMTIYWDFNSKSFIGEVPELDGCIISAKTLKDAFENLNMAMHKWIKKAQQIGVIIPEPLGKLPLRDELYCVNCKRIEEHSPRWIRSRE